MKILFDAGDDTSPPKRFVRDARGATAIEYSIVAAGVAMAVVGAVRALGNTVLTDLYEKIAAALS
jgi:Flp pilus assembly pilin Flp